MTKYIKTKIVIALESACDLTGHRWCNTLAGSSARLNDHWGLDVWPTVAETKDSE
jgi:hypothetical protein